LPRTNALLASRRAVSKQRAALRTAGAGNDTAAFARTYDQQQWAHAFGISQLFARGKPEVNWSYYLYNWYFGKPPPAVNGTMMRTARLG